MKKVLTLTCLLLFQVSFAQTSDTDEVSKETKNGSNAFNDFYPIAVKPALGYLSNMNSQEDIIFDAKPVVYYSIINDIIERMQSDDNKAGNAFYLSFQPHIRMYAENSKPVKTPSYRILFGWQHMIKTKSNNFFTWAIESGHYSNGQSGCAFLSGEEDESMPCTDFHATITDESNLSELLNRTNGNFSTNTTKLSLNFRFNELNGDDQPFKIHSFTASWELYHNRFFGLFDFGGYSDFDIRIYGRHRFGLGYEYIYQVKPKLRYAIEQKFEIIQGAHPFVEPVRSETTFTVYPFNRDIGFFATYVYGHDNYNYRFVDSGNQLGFGVSWDLFQPFQISRAKMKAL
ncbi:hypothetical protein KORDIASMS9_03909 [Kordia sp. SMS9]|uniref:hypothetical protein n=1 Tax=Kordia sp. SMS9 TaxID=2282170 RepID=UPI000E0DE59E|nr:hypothetical protein [Kordia sp. SMS9]AXG71652.1 hypothetical protein KORDIASMS9_03909 [Kordia sp. SMS9]